MALMVILLSLGAPTMAKWSQGRQIRTAAESIQNGLIMARGEAINRNSKVHFQFITTASAACELSQSGPNWGISLDDVDVAGMCDKFLANPADPSFLQIRTINEGSPNATINASVSRIAFNGLGQADSSAVIDISNPNGGTCRAAGGDMPCLRVTVSKSGQIRMCDPFEGLPASDPRRC